MPRRNAPSVIVAMIAAFSVPLVLSHSPAWAETAHTVAILPPQDQDSVAKALAKTANDLGCAAVTLSPEAFVSPEFTPERYPVAIYLGAERYLYQVKDPADGTDALLRYLADSGFLIVGGFVWPFYSPVAWTGSDYQRLDVSPLAGVKPLQRGSDPLLPGQIVERAFDIPLGLWIAGPDTTQFEKPEEEVLFRRTSDLLPHLPETLPFPAGDSRYRPCAAKAPRSVSIIQPLMTLVGASGKEYGPGILYVEHDSSYLPGAKVLYIWGGLLGGSGAEALLRDALVFALAETLNPQEVDAASKVLDRVRRTRERVQDLSGALESLGPEVIARDYLEALHRALIESIDVAEDLAKVGQIEMAKAQARKSESDCASLEARVKRASLSQPGQQEAERGGRGTEQEASEEGN